MMSLGVNTCMLLIYPVAMLFSDSIDFICAPLLQILRQEDAEFR